MIYPTPGRILIKKLEREVKAGEIFMPGSAIQEEGLLYGEIVRLPTKTQEKLTLHGVDYAVGMKVFYSKYSAAMVADEKGKSLYLVSDLDIMGIEENDAQTV